MALNERDPRDPQLERLYREAAREAPPVHLDAASGQVLKDKRDD